MRRNTALEFLKNLWGLGTKVGIGLSYRAARPDRLAEFIPKIDDRLKRREIITVRRQSYVSRLPKY
jgi:hypothetical protein